METLNLIIGLLVLLNVAAAFLTSFGKKHLKRTVIRLERTRDERRAKLLVVSKRKKSMDGTCNYMRKRKDEMINDIVSCKEDLERVDSGGAEDSAEDKGESGVDEALEDGEDKPISSWVDTVGGDRRESGGNDQKKDIKTRFPATERGEDLFT